MKTLKATSMWTLAVMAVLGVTTSVAQAGHYSDIDDHARDIEHFADRAQRNVRLGFRGLPRDLQQCLMTNMYRLEKKAECIDDLTRRPGNLNEIARHVEEMFGMISEVEAHLDELRNWCRSCDVPSHHRSSCGTMSRTHERALKEFFERTRKIRAALECMVDELDRLISPRCVTSRHRHDDHDRGVSRRPTIVLPPPAPRPPVVQPSTRFELGVSRGGSIWDRHDSWRRTTGASCSSRFGRSQSAFNVPVYRRSGSSFGFSMSFR